jgi:2-polyprenyl-3-methyl-5-hydroxy-6-metoxy-1,4-benzoquinol methylase
MSDAYHRFLEILPEGSRILDAGCGSGRDSKYFVDQGLDVVAFDASEKMVNHAREYAGVKVEKLRFDQLQYTEEFDGVWACASLLHVRKVEFVSTFQNLVNALKSSGVIYVSLKQRESSVPVGSRHFSYYSADEVNAIISDQPGLVLLDLWFDKNSECGWINFIAKRL